MRRGRLIGATLLGLAFLIAFAASASAAAPPAPEEPTPPPGFTLRGSHGFSISVSAYPASEFSAHAGITLTARRGKEFASYTAPAVVTADSIRARLGGLGRVDLVLHRSGREETTHIPCSKRRETFEAGTYEGVVEFNGEGGYTEARATRVAAVSAWSFFAARFPCGGGGSGQSFGPEEPGARLLGVSFAHGRILKFQINKNRPAGKTIFTASLAERRDGIRIFRELSGVAPAGAFHYGSKVRTATLSPPAPFLGTAHLTRTANAVSPRLRGDLKLAFPGHSVRLAGPGIHVSLEHARLTHGSTVGVKFRQ
jgi:hypothetical protein